MVGWLELIVTAVAVMAGLWVLSPIDLLPEFLPVIGPLDDVVVVALALCYAARRVPRQVLLEAWPGDPRLLERLLGAAAPVTHPPDFARLSAEELREDPGDRFVALVSRHLPSCCTIAPRSPSG